MADDGAPRAAKRARSAPAAGEGSSMVARQAAENAKLGRTGGIYVPPFKLAALRQEMADKDKRSAEFQRLSWDCLLYTSPSPRDRTRSRMPSSA